MRSIRKIIFVVLSLILINFGFAKGQEWDYELSSYEATFHLSEDGSDAYVTLKIVYDIGTEQKQDGFKFIGKNEIDLLSVTDGDGNSLDCRIDYLRETRIQWFFSPAKNMQQTVIAKFRVQNALSGTPWSDTFEAPWVGVWRVPVKNVTYKLVFPPRFSPEKIKTEPECMKQISQNDEVEVFAFQPLLTDESFKVTFSPAIVKHFSKVEFLLATIAILALVVIEVWRRRSEKTI